MNINDDGSVTTDLTGATPVLTAEHTSDAWGLRQVTLTLATGTRPPTPVLHAKVNASALRDLAASLVEAADEADRLYAEHGPRTPMGTHGG